LIQQLAPRQQALEAEAKAADAATHVAQAAAKEVQDRIYRARRTLDDVRSLAEASRQPSLRHRRLRSWRRFARNWRPVAPERGQPSGPWRKGTKGSWPPGSPRG
jgi:hypothetical protein